MEFVNYKCLESLLIEGKEITTEGYSESYKKGSLEELVDIANRISLHLKYGEKFIRYGYAEELFLYLAKNEYNERKFLQLINTSWRSISNAFYNSEYFVNKKDIILQEKLFYLGSHDIVPCDLFYSTSKKSFVLIDEKENLKSSDLIFIKYNDVINYYKNK